MGNSQGIFEEKQDGKIYSDGYHNYYSSTVIQPGGTGIRMDRSRTDRQAHPETPAHHTPALCQSSNCRTEGGRPFQQTALGPLTE